jgi:tRNA isopentenyl-2-thiomethyl-A-37 hydroxylase MiaE
MWARTTAKGEPAGARRCGGGALFAGEEEKKGRERNGGQLTLSSVVEDEASDFFSSLRTSESKHYRKFISLYDIQPSEAH